MIQENTPDALPFPILTLTAETIDPTPIMTLSKPFPTQGILSELTQLLPTTSVMLLKNTSIQTLPVTRPQPLGSPMKSVTSSS